MARKLKSLTAKRSNCPIAATLDRVGDKWSLLIIRDIGLLDKHRNKDFQDSTEGIPTNILANRLKKLTEEGLIEKRLYEERPPRYEYHLTPAGRSLLPVIGAMAEWASANITGVKIPEVIAGRNSRS